MFSVMVFGILSGLAGLVAFEIYQEVRGSGPGSGHVIKRKSGEARWALAALPMRR